MVTPQIQCWGHGLLFTEIGSGNRLANTFNPFPCHCLILSCSTFVGAVPSLSIKYPRKSSSTISLRTNSLYWFSLFQDFFPRYSTYLLLLVHFLAAIPVCWSLVLPWSPGWVSQCAQVLPPPVSWSWNSLSFTPGDSSNLCSLLSVSPQGVLWAPRATTQWRALGYPFI